MDCGKILVFFYSEYCHKHACCSFRLWLCPSGYQWGEFVFCCTGTNILRDPIILMGKGGVGSNANVQLLCWLWLCVEETFVLQWCCHITLLVMNGCFGTQRLRLRKTYDFLLVSILLSKATLYTMFVAMIYQYFDFKWFVSKYHNKRPCDFIIIILDM